MGRHTFGSDTHLQDCHTHTPTHLHTHTHLHTPKPRACTYPRRRVSVRHGQRPEQPRTAEDRGGPGEELAALLMNSEQLYQSALGSSEAGAYGAATHSLICLRAQIIEESPFFRVGRFVIRLNQPRM